MISIKSCLGKQIKKHRIKIGLSQEELAEKIGIATNNLGKIERGQNFVTAETLEKISSILSVQVKDLFDCEFQITIDQMKKELIETINNNKNVELLYKFLQSIS